VSVWNLYRLLSTLDYTKRVEHRLMSLSGIFLVAVCQSVQATRRCLCQAHVT
jgi:hypothetical protein